MLHVQAQKALYEWAVKRFPPISTSQELAIIAQMSLASPFPSSAYYTHCTHTHPMACHRILYGIVAAAGTAAVEAADIAAVACNCHTCCLWAAVCAATLRTDRCALDTADTAGYTAEMVPQLQEVDRHSLIARSHYLVRSCLGFGYAVGAHIPGVSAARRGSAWSRRQRSRYVRHGYCCCYYDSRYHCGGVHRRRYGLSCERGLWWIRCLCD